MASLLPRTKRCLTSVLYQCRSHWFLTPSPPMHTCPEYQSSKDPHLLHHLLLRTPGAMDHSLKTTEFLMPCHCLDEGARTREIRWFVQSYTALSAKARASLWVGRSEFGPEPPYWLPFPSGLSFSLSLKYFSQKMNRPFGGPHL